MTENDDEDMGYQRISLRIPRDLHERLMGAAKVTSKSMNAEIIGRLEASFSDIAQRLAAIEAIVFNEELGNVALSKEIFEVSQDLRYGLGHRG